MKARVTVYLWAKKGSQWVQVNKIPTKKNPHPKLPDPSKIYFLEKLYEVVRGRPSLKDPFVRSHVWLCDIDIVPKGGRWYRKMAVTNWQFPDVTLTAKDSTEAQIKAIDYL